MNTAIGFIIGFAIGYTAMSLFLNYLKSRNK